MLSTFTYLMIANSKSDSTNFATVVNSSPTTPVYLKPEVTYTGGAIEKSNISIVGSDGSIIPASNVTKTNGTIVLCGGTYTGSFAISGLGSDSDISVYVSGGHYTGTFFCGSYSGVSDRTIITTVTGGMIAKHLYGGGKVSAESTELTVEGGSVGQDVYGGLLINNAKKTISLGESNLTVSGGTFNQYVVGGSRVTAANTTTTHTVGKVNLTLAGGDFAFAGTTTDPGASIFGAGYVQGFNNTAAVNAQYQVAESCVTVATDITGAVYGGAFVSKSGLAQVDKANIKVSSGSVDRVYGGGWAQTNGISNVGEVSILIENGAKVNTIYAGGGNDSTSKTEVTGVVYITVIGSAAVKNIFMGGRHNNSLVSGDVTVTISGEAKTFARISGDGAYLKNTGTSSLVVDTIVNVAVLDGIDVITIHGNKTLTVTTSAELNKINLAIDSVTLPWVILSGADLSGIASVVFAVNGQEVAVTWIADNTTGVLGDTGYALKLTNSEIILLATGQGNAGGATVDELIKERNDFASAHPTLELVRDGGNVVTLTWYSASNSYYAKVDGHAYRAMAYVFGGTLEDQSNGTLSPHLVTWLDISEPNGGITLGCKGTYTGDFVEEIWPDGTDEETGLDMYGTYNVETLLVDDYGCSYGSYTIRIPESTTSN